MLAKLGYVQQHICDPNASTSLRTLCDQKGDSALSTHVYSVIERVILSRGRFTFVFSRDGKDRFDVERLDVD